MANFFQVTSHSNPFAPPNPVEPDARTDSRTLPLVLAISGFASAFVLLFLASLENWPDQVRLPMYMLIGVSTMAWRMRHRGRQLPLPGSSSLSEGAVVGLVSPIRPQAVATAQVNAATYPEVGDYSGQAAFVLPTLAKMQRRGFVIAWIFCALSLALTLVAPFPTNIIMGLSGLFFGYLGVLNTRGVKTLGAYFLTPDGLTVRDAGGTLSVAWSDITGLTRSSIGKAPTLQIQTVPGAVLATGSARRWLPLNRKLGAEFSLRPAMHLGGIELLEPLLMWCLAVQDRRLIGTIDGRAAFWQVPQEPRASS